MPEPRFQRAFEHRPRGGAGSPRPWLEWLGVALSVAVVVWFFGCFGAYGPDRSMSSLRYLASSWNAETDYEHGVLFPLLIVGLVAYRWNDLRAAAGEGERLGLLPLVLGCMLFVAAYRVIQWRVAVGALPLILWGGAWYLWGRNVAKILAFPLFFFWLSIPLPSFQQATVHLQRVATVLAHQGAALCGVDTYVRGTDIFSADGKWAPLSISGGCSGIRSLMALMMISAAWAYVAKVSLWKKVVLFASAVPLAIVGNALRVTSIFVIAEYGNAEWARKTWHDWSGLLLFYPFSLMLLLLLHSLLEGGLPWRRGARRVTRRRVIQSPASSNP
jgi:exosortase